MTTVTSRGPAAPSFQPVSAPARQNGSVSSAVSATLDEASTIQLSRAIPTHQGDVRTLTVRPPTLTDYIANGDIDVPVAMNFENGVATTLRVQTNHDALVRWAAALTGHDRVVLGNLGAADAGRLFEAVRTAVLPFTRGNSPSAPTN